MILPLTKRRGQCMQLNLSAAAAAPMLSSRPAGFDNYKYMPLLYFPEHSIGTMEYILIF